MKATVSRLMRQKRRPNSRTILLRLSLVSTFAVLFLLLCFEILLQVATDYPKGLINFTIQGKDSLYPRDTTFQMLWGAIPYSVETNALGFRGQNIPFAKREGTIRIAALGDSITDGFFVDNDATYPQLLQQQFDAEREGIEVINTARGGASIDRELAILREFVLPLHPDIVLLTFVTNDIAAIKNQSLERLLSATMRSRRSLARTLAVFIATKTAIGELLTNGYFRLRYEQYGTAIQRLGTQERYQIEGGQDYLDNAQTFNERYPMTDGLVLKEPFSTETDTHIGSYLAVLEEVQTVSQRNHIQLIFIYFPAYSQIYDDNTSLRIRDILQAACNGLNIPFLDLTPAFREQGWDAVLHLAPVDYHLNPRGNQVMARAVAQFIINGQFFGSIRVSQRHFAEAMT